MIKFQSLNQSKQFLRILKKKRLNTKYFTIYFEKNSSKIKKNDRKILNISFVMKKIIGNAVKRNKIKRKLKAAVTKLIKDKNIIDLNYNYIVFGKSNAYKEKFASIVKEMSITFKKIKQKNIN